MTTGTLDRHTELERKDASREALERAATRLENYATNEVYKRAFRIAARIVREIAKE